MAEQQQQSLQQLLEAEKKAIEAMTDITEMMLARACFNLQVAAGNGDATAPAKVVKARKALDEYRAGRDAAGTQTELRFKRLDSSKEPCVLSYLQSLGWSLKKTKLAQDAAAGKLIRRGEWYYAKDAEVYAKTWCKSTVVAPVDESLIDKNHEQARIARETADKLALNNEVLRGAYLPRNLVEQGLAERAAFLKQDLANFGPFMVDRFVEMSGQFLRSGGDPENLSSLIPDMVDEYDQRLERYLHRYASGEVVP